MSGWNDGGRGDKGTKRMLQPGRDFFTGEDEVVLLGGENNNLTSVKLGVSDGHVHHALRLQEQQIEQAMTHIFNDNNHINDTYQHTSWLVLYQVYNLHHL